MPWYVSLPHYGNDGESIVPETARNLRVNLFAFLDGSDIDTGHHDDGTL